MATTDITAERLRELLHYDPETGIFTWRIDAARCRRKGSIAGANADSGRYSSITIRRTIFKAHRLAWLYVHGSLPVGMIDHINGIKSDNRIANLRDVSFITNMENQRAAHSNNKLGIMGVTLFRGRYSAHIRTNKVLRFLGSFPTPELAHAAYIAAKREKHAGCTI